MRKDGILASLFNISEEWFWKLAKAATRKCLACAVNLKIGEKKNGCLFGSTTSPLPCWRDFGEKFERLGSSIVHLSIVDNVDKVDNTDKESIKIDKNMITQVRSLQQVAPPGLDDVLLKVSSWGDPSQVCRMF